MQRMVVQYQRSGGEEKDMWKMTSDDIIRMAKEAGFYIDEEANEILESDKWHTQTIWVERFAELVAAAEREACAQGCEHFGGFKDGYSCAAYIRARGQV